MQVTSTPAGLGWDNPVPPADPQPQEQAQPQPEPAAPATTTLGALMHPGQPLPTGNGNPWQGFETSQHKPQPSPLLDYPPDTAIALQLKPLLQEHAQPEADTPTEATTPAPPSADPMEIAALELLLAEPAAQELIQHFGGDLQPPPSGHAVADSIIARYGSDLASRLNQLQSAQQEVQKQYLATLDAAIATPGPQQPGSIFTPDTELGDVPEHLIALPSRPGQQQGQQGSWTLDPVAFTSAWAQGDSPLQRAYAHLHGAEGMQRVTFDAGMEYETTHWMLAGQKLHLATQRSGDADHDTAQSKLTDGWDRIDLERPPKLIDNDLVWFDPERGWVTDRKNLKPDGIDRAMPIVFGAAMSFMSMGAASAAMGLGAATSCTAAGATATTIGQSAILGAVGGATNQVVNMIGGGRFSFRQVLISAVSGGVAAGVTQLSGLGQMLQSGDTATRLLGRAGRAGLQGAIQQASGGRFADGFINSAMGSVASEVTQNLNSQIAQMEQQGLGASESSLLRLFSRAAGSALRVVGSNDPAAGFASDFLAGALAQATPADAQGETVADNGQATEGGARDTGQGPAPAAPASVTVAAGDTLERLARQQYGEHWRAGLTAMVADNPGIAANQWGSPIIQPGQTLNIPSLDGLSAEQLSHYGQLGGRIVAGNTQGLNVRAELLAAREAQQRAVQASGPATMSQDEAYARYMAAGGRSGGYAREMGEDYKPVWHQGEFGSASNGSAGTTAAETSLPEIEIQPRHAGGVTQAVSMGWREAFNPNNSLGERLAYGSLALAGTPNMLVESMLYAPLNAAPAAREMGQYIARAGMQTDASERNMDILRAVSTGAEAFDSVGAWLPGPRAQGATTAMPAREFGNASEGTFYNVASNGVRGEVPLTPQQRVQIEDYLSRFDTEGLSVRWVDNSNLNTAYGSMYGEHILNIGSDVIPGGVGVGTLTANSRVSTNGALAHELVGHMEAGMAGRTQDLLHLEEAQASIRAARFAPGLTSIERFTLLRDAITRLQNAPEGPIKIRDVRDLLYIWKR
ncbi:MAG: LysM peptidoglycan-binding domain-containing protein [Ottowia sp.]|uniref:LysM peptidoglycan-binding domain-containing protein n=1 Tax=Ottowia sp. TaxID=1898956 RepID=UPI0039E6D3FD